MSNLASALTGLGGELVALCDVDVSAVLRDLLAEVTVAQTYRNDEPVSIEAVYTFPLPLDAVLLDLEVDIGGRVLKGVVVEKKAAEEKYEDAVEAGDAAVMLQAIEPGLYTMNVGNLLPRETAKITFRYAMLYRWSGDRLRLFLPTTIAPRYGQSRHQPQQVPEHSLTVENQFSLSVDVFGALRDAQFVCPSHSVVLQKLPQSTRLSLVQAKAAMDRDFILNVKAPQATRSFALCGQDGDGQAVVASFQPFFPGLQQARPLNLAIVIDCSGSMGGDSMAQAKQAIENILDALHARDRVSIIAFGNSTKRLADRPLACNKTSLAKAKRFAKALDADMGGTEIGGALEEAYAVACRDGAADIFLVTDGEVSSWEKVVGDAKASGHRIFTVGVGSAVSEAFVRGLASATGGACELVSPREGMTDRVVRHFERMRAPRASQVTVRWPEGAVNMTPTHWGAVFEGDTVVAYARFAGSPVQGTAVLEVKTDAGESFQQILELPLSTPAAGAEGLSTVARVAAAARLAEAGGPDGLETALHYRLVSPWTNWLVVAPRPDDEKAQDMPALRKVPQTLAAGWGATGSVTMSMAGISFMARDAMPTLSVDDRWLDQMLIPETTPESRRTLEVPEPYRRLIELVNDDPSRLSSSAALDLLVESGMEATVADLLRHASELDLAVEVIAAIVLARLLGGALGDHLNGAAQAALPALQDHAQKATEALREMGRHGTALMRLTQKAPGRELLRRASDDDALGRLSRVTELLAHLDDVVRIASARLQGAKSELTAD